MTKLLVPQHLKPSYWEEVYKDLREIFYDILFKPVMKVLQGHGQKVQLENAPNALLAALKSGKVQYQDGEFSGQFTAAISIQLKSMGAKMDRHTKTFKLSPAQVPSWVSAAAGVARSLAKDAHALIDKGLRDVQDNLDRLVAKKDVDAAKGLNKMQKDFRPIAARLSVAPELSTESKARLAKEYNQNMKLWIKKFTEEQITELRGIVEQNAEGGYRFDRLTDELRQRYLVSKNKARFLARQETGLFMSKFRRERFQEAGVRKYEWSAVMDARTRHDHRSLNGRVFLYSEPPIVDKDTGRKANPGEDYNCRCVDIPIIEEVAA